MVVNVWFGKVWLKIGLMGTFARPFAFLWTFVRGFGAVVKTEMPGYVSNYDDFTRGVTGAYPLQLSQRNGKKSSTLQCCIWQCPLMASPFISV
jgi:hypothetical protein